MTGLRSVRWLHAALLALGATLPSPAFAQTKAAVEQERRAFAEWIATAPVSPFRAVVVRPIGTVGLTIGPPSADIPLAGVAAGKLAERNGRVILERGGETLALPRGRPVMLGDWRLVASGRPGRAAVTVFGGAGKNKKPPTHYPYDAKSAYVVSLTPPAAPRSQPLLSPDGVEVEATVAGTVTVPAGERTVTLTVMRLPGATEDESELEIFFRDGTSGKGTYLAGRFVSLIPLPGNRYSLDFNRARNPFCAYNTVYPCPALWRGNTLDRPIAAGEKYAGGGLDKPPT
jgi:hypothetical protein